jgi:hypothetical protein
LHLRGQFDALAHRIGKLGWNVEQTAAATRLA